MIEFACAHPWHALAAGLGAVYLAIFVLEAVTSCLVRIIVAWRKSGP